jgi:transcription elongation factor Elf1
MKAWRHTDIDQCPRCGSDLEIFTNAPVDEAFDGDDARCVECGFYSAMTVDEYGAGVQDNDWEAEK